MTENIQGTLGGIAAADLVAASEHAVTVRSAGGAFEVPDHRPPAAAETNVVRMPVLAPVASVPERAGSPARVLWPTEPDAEEEPPDSAPPSGRIPVAWLRAAYVAAAFGGAFGAFAMLGPRRAASDVAESAAGRVLPVEALDAQADTLARALAAFALRADLFEARQMTCEDLARGLVHIDDQWMAYNAVRKVAPATLDSARTALDRAAQANVRAAERRFERSGCARP